ncbi:unnamed protein product [Discosporangium mesarthrocarpum]
MRCGLIFLIVSALARGLAQDASSVDDPSSKAQSLCYELTEKLKTLHDEKLEISEQISSMHQGWWSWLGATRRWLFQDRQIATDNALAAAVAAMILGMGMAHFTFI